MKQGNGSRHVRFLDDDVGQNSYTRLPDSGKEPSRCMRRREVQLGRTRYMVQSYDCPQSTFHEQIRRLIWREWEEEQAGRS